MGARTLAPLLVAALAVAVTAAVAAPCARVLQTPDGSVWVMDGHSRRRAPSLAVLRTHGLNPPFPSVAHDELAAVAEGPMLLDASTSRSSRAVAAYDVVAVNHLPLAIHHHMHAGGFSATSLWVWLWHVPSADVTQSRPLAVVHSTPRQAHVVSPGVFLGVRPHPDRLFFAVRSDAFVGFHAPGAAPPMAWARINIVIDATSMWAFVNGVHVGTVDVPKGRPGSESPLLNNRVLHVGSDKSALGVPLLLSNLTHVWGDAAVAADGLQAAARPVVVQPPSPPLWSLALLKGLWAPMPSPAPSVPPSTPPPPPPPPSSEPPAASSVFSQAAAPPPKPKAQDLERVPVAAAATADSVSETPTASPVSSHLPPAILSRVKAALRSMDSGDAYTSAAHPDRASVADTLYFLSVACSSYSLPSTGRDCVPPPLLGFLPDAAPGDWVLSSRSAVSHLYLLLAALVPDSNALGTPPVFPHTVPDVVSPHTAAALRSVTRLVDTVSPPLHSEASASVRDALRTLHTEFRWEDAASAALGHRHLVGYGPKRGLPCPTATYGDTGGVGGVLWAGLDGVPDDGAPPEPPCAEGRGTSSDPDVCPPLGAAVDCAVAAVHLRWAATQAVRHRAAKAPRGEDLRLSTGEWEDFHGHEDAVADFLEFAASTGDARAKLGLAQRAYHGRGGMDRNPVVAARLFQEAADAGAPEARYNLAVMRMNGEGGLERDPEGAMADFEAASSAGFVQASNELARQHLNGGKGVPRNASRALELFEKAAAVGNLDGLYNAGQLLREGRGTPQDVPAGLWHLATAAVQGHKKALLELGAAYTQPGSWLDLYHEAVMVERAQRTANASNAACEVPPAAFTATLPVAFSKTTPVFPQWAYNVSTPAHTMGEGVLPGPQPTESITLEVSSGTVTTTRSFPLRLSCATGVALLRDAVDTGPWSGVTRLALTAFLDEDLLAASRLYAMAAATGVVSAQANVAHLYRESAAAVEAAGLEAGAVGTAAGRVPMPPLGSDAYLADRVMAGEFDSGVPHTGAQLLIASGHLSATAAAAYIQAAVMLDAESAVRAGSLLNSGAASWGGVKRADLLWLAALAHSSPEALFNLGVMALRCDLEDAAQPGSPCLDAAGVDLATAQRFFDASAAAARGEEFTPDAPAAGADTDANPAVAWPQLPPAAGLPGTMAGAGVQLLAACMENYAWLCGPMATALKQVFADS